MAVIPDTHNTGLTPTQIDTAFSNALTHVPSSSTPAMDGTGAAGTADTFARGDHEHPHDTTKQDTLAFEGTYNASTNKVTTMSAVKDGKLTGYVQSSGDIAATDKIIEAIGKVEKKADDNKTNISLIEDANGKKNLSTATGGTNVGAGYIVDNTAIDLPAGDYVFSWKNSVYTGGVACVINCYTTASGSEGRVVNENQANTASEARMITVPQDCIRFNIYCTGANTITDLMICTKAQWDISHTYQPYAMSNVELTPTVYDSGTNFTVGTDYTLATDCTLTIPAPSTGQSTKVANIMASLTFNSSPPRGIILSTSNIKSDPDNPNNNFDSNMKLLAKVESTNHVLLSAQCMFFNYSGSATKIYVWVKSSSAANNRVVSAMQLLN